MVVDHERFESFLESIPDSLPEHLVELELENIKENIPIIRKGSQHLIRFMLELSRPLRILEIGTATGFSAIFMLSFLVKADRITRNEMMEAREVKAEENLTRMGR